MLHDNDPERVLFTLIYKLEEDEEKVYFKSEYGVISRARIFMREYLFPGKYTGICSGFNS